MTLNSTSKVSRLAARGRRPSSLTSREEAQSQSRRGRRIATHSHTRESQQEQPTPRHWVCFFLITFPPESSGSATEFSGGRNIAQGATPPTSRGGELSPGVRLRCHSGSGTFVLLIIAVFKKMAVVRSEPEGGMEGGREGGEVEGDCRF